MPHLPARLFFTIIHIAHIAHIAHINHIAHIAHIDHISFIFHTMKTKGKKQINPVIQASGPHFGDPRMAQNASSHLFPGEFPYFEPDSGVWKWTDVKKRLLF